MRTALHIFFDKKNIGPQRTFTVTDSLLLSHMPNPNSFTSNRNHFSVFLSHAITRWLAKTMILFPLPEKG